MIDRYSTSEMTKIWSDQNKHERWLEVELAVILANVELGVYDKEVFERINAQARFDLNRIYELDKELQHDLIAFVNAVQENLDPDLRKYLHEDITSYDTEEPAMSLMLRDSIGKILEELDALAYVLADKAFSYKYVLKIQRTHGQHAQPSTVGLEFLWWYDSLVRQVKFLRLACKEIVFTKLSGAVGTYEGNLSPELERITLGILGLEVAPTSMQIILRDRHAHVMNAMAVLAGVIENIALNIQLMGQTEICEYQEPFSEKQKGSSIMPHKKNTIKSENLKGLSRLARALAAPALENIPTWSGRDISHSSVERMIFPGMFNLVHFALRRTKKLVDGLVIHDENIEKNMDFTQGRIFSPDVKSILLDAGIDSELAYRIPQQAAFKSFEQDESYLTILLNNDEVPDDVKKELPNLFNWENKVHHVDEVFDRFNDKTHFVAARNR